jgi:phenylacetate-CoA ligase
MEQFQRIQVLVALAYDEIPVYREKYLAAGFKPTDLRSWDDFAAIPPITKDELIRAFPERCVNRRFARDRLFASRSSGSSGVILPIRADFDAVVSDTLHGIRQFILQSDGKYCADSLLAQVYTIPWWFHSIGSAYRTAFISSVIATPTIGQILRTLEPEVISCYPTTLEALLATSAQFASPELRLVVTHSESSVPLTRGRWGEALGVPVLDEYSSEEATRIALELPCGHYHVCEDAVYLEVLNPITLQPDSAGVPGLAVVTNLLNEAMPFIRYVQGDYITRPKTESPCDVEWSQLARVDGRANDSFINRNGQSIPAGTILDLTYRWMLDCVVDVREFEVVQERIDLVRLFCIMGDAGVTSRLHKSIGHLQDLFELSFEHPIRLECDVLESLPVRTGKRRPIRSQVVRG